jgi:hypothetical protein
MSLWKNRIVGYADVDPATLTPHHGNWRLHPKAQQMALAGVLSEIGIVQNVLVNQRTGRLVDGHLRVELALEHKQPAIGVTYVDLSESEEAAILATLDPLSALAETDAEALGNLLGQFSFESSAVNDMLSGLLMPADDGLFADEPEATARRTVPPSCPTKPYGPRSACGCRPPLSSFTRPCRTSSAARMSPPSSWICSTAHRQLSEFEAPVKPSYDLLFIAHMIGIGILSGCFVALACLTVTIIAGYPWLPIVLGGALFGLIGALSEMGKL